MVFCNTRTNTDFVASNLKALGIGAMTIHGGLTQDKRDRIMKQFHSHDVRVLVCTDVAARGLDIPPVSHIYNYDIPMYGKDYIHRIGRTARAGKDGVAINILASRDYDSFRRIMKSNEVTITEEKLPDVKKVRISRMNRPKRTFRPGRRPHSN
jgi:ATP-dependent RNA helicase DeaD